jgi:hypothetical protein
MVVWGMVWSFSNPNSKKLSSHKPLHWMLDPHFRCFPYFRSCWKLVLGEVRGFYYFFHNFVISLIGIINKMENENKRLATVQEYSS